jgi:hypothetical protein
MGVAIEGPEDAPHGYWPTPFGWFTYENMWREVSQESAYDFGRQLWHTNAVAISHRYTNLREEVAIYEFPPGFTSDYTTIEYEYRRPSRLPTIVEALKLIDCYTYQTCKHHSWRETDAFWFCCALRGELIATLPGYADAPWVWKGGSH